MTPVRTRKAKLILGLIAVAVGLAIISDWYYKEFVWPAGIQKQIFGRQIVRHGQLISRNGYSSYGDGVHEWYYSISPGTDLGRLCRDRPETQCEFTLNKRISSDVLLQASLSRGTLKLSEVWF